MTCTTHHACGCLQAKIDAQEVELKLLRAVEDAAGSLLSEDDAREALLHYVVLQILQDKLTELSTWREKQA